MPEELANHLRALARVNELDQDEKNFKHFLKAWLSKKAHFDKDVEKQGLTLVQQASKDTPQGMLILTYSGSFLTVSPLNENAKREIVYISLDFRKDAPHKIADEQGELQTDPSEGEVLKLKCGKVKSTSPVLSIALIPQEVSHAQNKISRQNLEQSISNNFLKVNQDLKVSQGSTVKAVPEHPLKERDDLFEEWKVLEWFRIGGWQEDVFIMRARILWHELFDEVYVQLLEKTANQSEAEQVFKNLYNGRFLKFIDDYKWIESEKRDFDIGLMRALEDIPPRGDYKELLKNYLAEA
jgi:hypothetical protein